MRRSDRRILSALLVVAVLALAGIYVAGRSGGSSSAAPAATGAPVAGALQRSHEPFAVDVPPAETFPFDPNTADSTQLLRLGLQPWQVRNIYKYRARGGIYRTKEDFARLYGLTVKDYRRLEPYIRIAADYRPAATLLVRRSPLSADSIPRPQKIAAGEHIELNAADTLDLMRVPGIGIFYASEIVRHRSWLGGYVSVEQLDEIDHFPAEAKRYFAVTDPHPRQLHINRLSWQQLRRHPYINFHQAKAIADYRRLHGDIKSLDQLRLLPDFPPEAIERLRPYVAY